MNAISHPNRVQHKPLGEIATFLDHMRRPVRESERKLGPYPYYGANGHQGTIDGYLFDEPLVLMAEDGGHFDEPERGIAYRVSGKVWVNNHAHVLRPNPGTDWAYLTRALGNREVRQFVSGTTRGKLTKGQAEKIMVPLPPLPEQRRIAAILDQADALRAKRREALAKLDEMAQAIFVEMFGNGSSESYQINLESLGKHLSFVTSGGRNWARFYAEKGRRFIRSLDVRMNKIADDDAVFVSPPDNAESKRTRVQAGDVLLTITGSCIGRVSAVDREFDGAHISQHVAILRLKKTMLPKYLSYYLSLPHGGQVQVSRLQYGQTKPGLNFDQIKRFEIPVPSIQAQKAFVKRLEQIDALREQQSSAEGKLDSLFLSLQHRAFSGVL